MRKALLIISLILSPVVASAQTQTADPAWRTCRDDGDCVAVVEGCCHAPSAINAASMDAWKIWNDHKLNIIR